MPSLPEIIETQRLKLRPFSTRDVDDVYAYASDPDWQRFLPVPVPYTRDDAVQFVATATGADWSQQPIWAITVDDATVGGVNIRFTHNDRVAEIGYSIARPLWGRGLVTESAAAIVERAFASSPSLERVWASAIVDNVGSTRVMEKLGMTCEGTLRSALLKGDELFDQKVYAVLRGEWRSTAQGTQPRS